MHVTLGLIACCLLIGLACRVCRIRFPLVGRINYSIQPDSAYTTGTTNQKTLVSDPGVDEKMLSDERKRERDKTI